MYTSTFINKQTGNHEVSRYFETKKAAVKWRKWLRQQKFVSQTTIYHGQAGGMILERIDVDHEASNGELEYSCGCKYETREPSRYYDHLCASCYVFACSPNR